VVGIMLGLARRVSYASAAGWHSASQNTAAQVVDLREARLAQEAAGHRRLRPRRQVTTVGPSLYFCKPDLVLEPFIGMFWALMMCPWRNPPRPHVDDDRVPVVNQVCRSRGVTDPFRPPPGCKRAGRAHHEGQEQRPMVGNELDQLRVCIGGGVSGAGE